MTSIKNLTYLAVAAVAGLWGCSSNQFASRSGATYDDLYGSSADVQVAARSNSPEQDSRYANPEYQGSTSNNSEGQSADYYDESYLTSRNVQRRVSDDPGFNAGFREGYYTGRDAAFDPFFMNSMRYGSYWPMAGSAFSMGFQMGLNRSLRLGLSPFMSYGYGFGNPWRYSPYGYSGWDTFGYDPFFNNSLAYGGLYSPFGYGMYNGFSPFGYSIWNNYNPYYGGFGNRVLVVNNNYDQGTVSRGYGPRSSVRRSNESYNGDFSNTIRTSRANSGREAYVPGAESTTRGTTTDSYYARPRANSSGTYYYGNGSSARTSAEGNSSRGSSGYYSTPRSNSGNYSTPRSSRTYESGAYNSRGTTNNSTYQSNRSWESGARSNSSVPSYNNGSSRGSVSMPSSSSSSGSSSSSPRSRGPR